MANYEMTNEKRIEDLENQKMVWDWNEKGEVDFWGSWEKSHPKEAAELERLKSA